MCQGLLTPSFASLTSDDEAELSDGVKLEDVSEHFGEVFITKTSC